MGDIVGKFAFNPPDPPTYGPDLTGLLFINSSDYSASNFRATPNDVPAVFHNRTKNSPRIPFTIIFTHGNAEDIGSNLQRWLIYLSTYLGVNIISYEYSGYGITNNLPPSEKSCYKSILVVWNYLVHTLRIPPQCIILMGRSLGSGPSVHLAYELSRKSKKNMRRLRKVQEDLVSLKESKSKQRELLQRKEADLFVLSQLRPGALILQSPIASCIRVVSKALAVLPFDLFVNIKKVHEISCPILIAHGTEDEVVPFRHSLLLWENCAGSSRFMFLPIHQAGHNNIESLQLYREQFLKALRDLVLELRKRHNEKADTSLSLVTFSGSGSMDCRSESRTLSLSESCSRTSRTEPMSFRSASYNEIECSEIINGDRKHWSFSHTSTSPNPLEFERERRVAISEDFGDQSLRSRKKEKKEKKKKIRKLEKKLTSDVLDDHCEITEIDTFPNATREERISNVINNDDDDDDETDREYDESYDEDDI